MVDGGYSGLCIFLCHFTINCVSVSIIMFKFSNFLLITFEFMLAVVLLPKCKIRLFLQQI